MEKVIEFIAAILIVVAVTFVIAVLYALPIMLLWNWLMPEIFGLKMISFWQAFGLNFLSGLLIKSGSSSSKD